MRRKTGVTPKEVRARCSLIRSAIGRMLSAQYDVAAPLPDRLADLLRRLESGEISDHRFELRQGLKEAAG
jgi:hypothetical protein